MNEKNIKFYVQAKNVDTWPLEESVLVLTKGGDLIPAIKEVEKKYPHWVGRCQMEPWLTAPDPLSDNERHRITTISQLPKGCYFRLVNPATGKVNPTVYVRDDYDRSTRRYCAYRFDDVCSSRDFKPDRTVCIDFTF